MSRAECLAPALTASSRIVCNCHTPTCDLHPHLACHHCGQRVRSYQCKTAAQILVEAHSGPDGKPCPSIVPALFRNWRPRALPQPELRDYADYERARCAQQGYGMRTIYRELE